MSTILVPLSNPESPIQNFRTQTDADRHYLGQAFMLRSESDDPKAKLILRSGVGAIVAKLDGEVARSANVLPPRLKKTYVDREREIVEDERYFVLEHAERAVLFKAYNAGIDLSDATLYCTRFPCSDCARAIAWSKIARLVVPMGFKGEVRWLDAQRAALRILRDSGVVVRYLPMSDN